MVALNRRRGRVVLVESIADLERRVATGAISMEGWRLRGLDLTGHSELLDRLDPAGATFVGCVLAPDDRDRVEAAGALVLPAIPEVPVDVYRSTLYAASDLYDTARYADSLDARAYAWSQQRVTAESALARALHDHAIDEALAAWVKGRRLVGVMGGHAIPRGTPQYAAAARLGHGLARQGLVVATGGGPGAMEAANLGAYLGGQPVAAVEDAARRLGAVPSFQPSVPAWARAAFAVREQWPEGGESLGVPTWHYGHEPPNVFASVIAKYFRNALREAILVQICSAGVVFLPGAAGTVQEVFQDGCENYYADASSIAPMVLVGVRHWTEELPVWPLLHRMARGRIMADCIHLVDTVDEAAAVLAAGVAPPEPD